MHTDSIETLLSRHYGSLAPVPPDLETRLRANLARQAAAQESAERIARLLGERRFSRRRAAALVALGAAGAGVLSLSLEGLQLLLNQRDVTTRPAYG
jgi:ferric-dicitrate binding protein FerR (iron transport regulator)